MSLSNYLENKILDWVKNTPPPSAPQYPYFSNPVLHDSDPPLQDSESVCIWAYKSNESQPVSSIFLLGNKK